MTENREFSARISGTQAHSSKLAEHPSRQNKAMKMCEVSGKSHARGKDANSAAGCLVSAA